MLGQFLINKKACLYFLEDTGSGEALEIKKKMLLNSNLERITLEVQDSYFIITLNWGKKEICKPNKSISDDP